MSDLDSHSREELVALVVQLYHRVTELQELSAAQQAEIARLRSGPPSGTGATKNTPSWLKPNRPKSQTQKPRKKRSCAHVRPPDRPTTSVEHAADCCPDCGHKLHDGTIKRTRLIVDIPVAAAEVTEHRIISRWCGVCRKQVVPTVDFSAQAVGKSRIGIRAMSLVAYLKTTCRMPVDTICTFLEAHYNLHLSAGEVVDILRRVREAGKAEAHALLLLLRRQPYIHADETGWRENGQNGYIWSFSAPGIRHYVRDASRSHDVPEKVLGDFAGILTSDFYGGYYYYLGEHQRCWVHLLRDIKELKEKHPASKSVAAFAARVHKVYEEAREFRDDRPKTRRQKRFALQRQTCALARRYIRSPGPETTLARRLERFASELFTFVEYPDVPSDNNAAERAIRPAVIARKVCGGTRSDQGSRTMETLMSLFGTWHARGENLIAQCERMLATAPTPQPAA